MIRWRTDVACKITHASICALRRPLNPEKPDFALMQQLHDAGISKCPFSSMPIFDPSACTHELQTALWRAYCGVATTINKRVLGQTNEALQELQEQLHNHAARPAKRLRATRDDEAPRSSSPASLLSDEGTDTGEPANRQHRKRQRKSDESIAEGSVPRFAGSYDTTELPQLAIVPLSAHGQELKMAAAVAL